MTSQDNDEPELWDCPGCTLGGRFSGGHSEEDRDKSKQLDWDFHHAERKLPLNAAIIARKPLGVRGFQPSYSSGNCRKIPITLIDP
jgi:hypothetical protein